MTNRYENYKAKRVLGVIKSKNGLINAYVHEADMGTGMGTCIVLTYSNMLLCYNFAEMFDGTFRKYSYEVDC